MVIIFDNSKTKYFSVSGLTNTSGTNDSKNTSSDVKSKNSDSKNTSSDSMNTSSDTKVGGGVIKYPINIPVSLDSVPNDLKNSVPNDLKNSVPNDLKNTQNTHTRDLFEQVKKNMSDKTYSRTKIGDGFMRIDRL